MIEFAQARTNMVESQVRPNKVTDRRIIDAMLDIPREVFVPPSMRALAYMDQEIMFESAGSNAPERFMIAPMTLAQLIQLAEVDEQSLVLDVGCTTGYSSVILSRLSAAVVGLECDTALVDAATRNVMDLEADNAAIVEGPLEKGYLDEGPYDAIVLQGSVPKMPVELCSQLKHGGRLVAVIGNRDRGEGCLVRNIGGDLTMVSAFDAGAPRLPGFEVATEFVF
jgi:protein-L-isoaspartate(D-aspartate) O-methyltransferase